MTLPPPEIGNIVLAFDPFTAIFAIGMLIASYFISAALTPKPIKPERASLEDFDYPRIEEGTPQCVIFGDVWIPDHMVLWYGNLRTSPVKSEEGGK